MPRQQQRREFGPFLRESRVSRRGGVALEFILVLPVLLIVLLAVIEFGTFFANMQQVTLAARVGAETASQTAGLPSTSGGSVPTRILQAIDQQLDTAGVNNYTVILQHNVPGATVELTSTEGSGPSCSPATALPTVVARSVSVQICVLMDDLAPNLLAPLGFDLTGRHGECVTTFRYELSTP